MMRDFFMAPSFPTRYGGTAFSHGLNQANVKVWLIGRLEFVVRPTRQRSSVNAALTAAQTAVSG